MRAREFEDLLVKLIESDDHPEIVSAVALSEDENDTKHTRVRVNFASGATGYVMVGQVAGPGVQPHRQFELPKEVR